MTKKIPTVIQEYEKVCEDVAREFLERYFPESVYEEEYWVADEIGGMFCVGDYYFGIPRMTEALRYEATSKQLFDYYEAEIELGMKEKSPSVNFFYYVKTRMSLADLLK